MQTSYNKVFASDEAAASRKQRYVRKEGNCEVVFRHVPAEWLLFVTDIFTTLVEIRWRVMFLIFALSYILSWLFFGILFWVIALAHGDTQDPKTAPCVYEVRSFTAAFLFSLETQTTIGYGARGMSENCTAAILVVTVQDVVSCLIDTFVIGVAVSKMASARKRAQTVGFSSCAVINLRDGHLCLSWRVGDFRRHHLVEGTARAQIVRSAVHATGKVDMTYEDLRLQQPDIVLVTPTTVCHRIAARSPLYGMSPARLRRSDLEVVVSFTYTDDSTGTLHQSRTSYTPHDILWGHVFQEMIRAGRRRYTVDYVLFHQTAKVLMPELSAQAFELKKRSPRPGSTPESRRPGNLLHPPVVTVRSAKEDRRAETISRPHVLPPSDMLTPPVALMPPDMLMPPVGLTPSHMLTPPVALMSPDMLTSPVALMPPDATRREM
ncbi:inward rectifier potassium channel 16 [Nerophis lumbriciformis]|uniref:inward rectifier potassium channel 16 n=1 Tax=Nerophis lumbriciformis TaxID=546530 RepID=UPI002ADF720C|nr:inward rectifier potassium channel 16-like [Nerophis lumbriciformis]XP_061783179.1 inward rectifier potassium channel 16-like [Nerophis lumbriciformis]XP_061783180.1 inward rectifier potassium channel 16-like [Nerophis lumbriciformis]